jgi:hypothetical protein
MRPQHSSAPRRQMRKTIRGAECRGRGRQVPSEDKEFDPSTHLACQGQDTPPTFTPVVLAQACTNAVPDGENVAADVSSLLLKLLIFSYTLRY